MSTAMNPQLAGLEDVAGTYPFDLRASHRALKLNRFFWRMVQPEWRQRFAADPEALMTDAGLSDQEKALVRARDWIGLVRYGVCFFVMEKFARVARMSNLEVYAAMRGESFEAFMQTRRVPDAR
jgi:protocatechuate 4,5-dioxygenase alpha chain